MAKIKSLIPGFEEYMDGALPDEDTESVGSDGDLSKEVDYNGQPIPPIEQEEVRENLKMSARETPSGQPDPGDWVPLSMNMDKGNLPYCPVFATPKPNGGRIFTAYLNGTIEDVDQYLDLIDTLLTGTEQDVFYIFEDSPGGYVASGGIIASAIHHSKAEVFTVARGLCASSAALIHSAAKPGHALASPFAVMMYHMSSHFAMGTSTIIAREATDQVRYVNECLLNKAVDDGHITREEFEKIQNGEEIFIPAVEFLKRTTPQEQPQEEANS